MNVNNAILFGNLIDILTLIVNCSPLIEAHFLNEYRLFKYIHILPNHNQSFTTILFLNLLIFEVPNKNKNSNGNPCILCYVRILRHQFGRTCVLYPR